jgi:hypothetical protein
MADIEIEIDDLTEGTLLATSILHSKDNSGDDIQGTVQDILDLVPTVDIDTYNYEVGSTITSGSDYILFTDASDSGQVKRATFANIKNALNVLSVSGAVTSGYYNIGDLQIRWGEVVNDQDALQTYTFTVPFTTTCMGVWLNRDEPGGTAINARFQTRTGFSIDRSDEISGSYDVQYFAIGR